MEKIRIDKTQDLSDWLDKNAKVVAEPEDMANGHGKETIYSCPVSKEEEFKKLFFKAFFDWDSFDEYGGPGENEVWKVVTGPCEPSAGPYKWRKQGYDFDGFYESGASGKFDCLRYWSFREATVYEWFDRILHRDRRSISIDSYADGSYCMLYVVCFVDDKKEAKVGRGLSHDGNARCSSVVQMG